MKYIRTLKDISEIMSYMLDKSQQNGQLAFGHAFLLEQW